MVLIRVTVIVGRSKGNSVRSRARVRQLPLIRLGLHACLRWRARVRSRLVVTVWVLGRVRVRVRVRVGGLLPMTSHSICYIRVG